MRRLAPVVALLVLASGCGGGENRSARPTVATDPAARFAVRLDANLAKRRFRLAWRSLHPAQQRILSARALAACWSKSRTSDLEHRLRFVARRVRDEPARIPGGPRRPQPSRAISIRVLDPSGNVLDSFEQHVFAVGGSWRWIVSAGILHAFRSGSCG
jgi:hypothetical protein